MIGIIMILVLIGSLIAWAEVLFYLGGDNNKLLFSIVYAIPFLGSIFLNLTLILQSSTNFSTIIGIISLAYITFLGITFFEQGGKQQRRWFYLTIIFPFLAIVYQFTRE